MNQRIPLLASALAVVLTLGGCALVPLAGGIQAEQARAADDAAAKADVLNAKVAFLSYAIENNAEYPQSAELLYDYGYEPTGDTGEVTLVVYTDISFCIQAVSGSGATFSTTDDGTAVEGGCA
jgi:hypothetical protein